LSVLTVGCPALVRQSPSTSSCLCATNRLGNRAEVVRTVVDDPIFLRSGRAPLCMSSSPLLRPNLLQQSSYFGNLAVEPHAHKILTGENPLWPPLSLFVRSRDRSCVSIRHRSERTPARPCFSRRRHSPASPTDGTPLRPSTPARWRRRAPGGHARASCRCLSRCFALAARQRRRRHESTRAAGGNLISMQFCK
jgi:hypothetical protein